MAQLDPLLYEDDDASGRRRSAAVYCRLIGQPVPREWAVAMRRVWWYRAYPCCTRFPFRSMGVAIALNGIASYASDVVYLGEPVNPWKRVDLALATANTVIQVLIAILQTTGYLSFPTLSGAVFAASVATALYSKRRSVMAVSERDMSACIFWHALWHYTLPGGALLAQLLLSWESTEPLLKDGL